MKELNKLRLNAGIPIDPSIEITVKPQQVNEARATPRRRRDLTNTDPKSLKKQVRGLEQATKYVTSAIEALEKIPATDFQGDVPMYIGELEDILDSGGSGGMEAYLEKLSSNLRKTDGAAKKIARKEAEEEEYEELQAAREEEEFEAQRAADAKAEERECSEGDQDLDAFISTLSDIQRNQLAVAIKALQLADTDAVIRESAYNTVAELMDDRLDEALHYYEVDYDGFTGKKGRPVNVADGTSDAKQVWDEEEEKNESPEQTKTMDQQDNSPVDKSGDDLSTKIKVPTSIKTALKKEITKANAEADKMDVRDKDAAYFYKDLANAFSDLLGHLEKGTRYDLKQAQIFAQTLMGPMLHKIPNNVWKFITNGGETSSLKSYFKPVDKKYPITGPRDVLK